MIILYSAKLLEHLTEIEDYIKQIENYIERSGIEVDREKILEAVLTSRIQEKN